jgi:hypothetical protein
MLFLIKNYHLPIPRPPERMFKLQRKPSALKRKHSALQNMNFSIFYGSFLPSWIRIWIPNLDPDPNPLSDYIRIRIHCLIISGSETLSNSYRCRWPADTCIHEDKSHYCHAYYCTPLMRNEG